MQQISPHSFFFLFYESVIMLGSACLTKESYISNNCSCKAENKQKKRRRSADEVYHWPFTLLSRRLKVFKCLPVRPHTVVVHTTGRSGSYSMIGCYFGEKSMVVKIKMQKWIKL